MSENARPIGRCSRLARALLLSWKQMIPYAPSGLGVPDWLILMDHPTVLWIVVPIAGLLILRGILLLVPQSARRTGHRASVTTISRRPRRPTTRRRVHGAAVARLQRREGW